MRLTKSEPSCPLKDDALQETLMAVLRNAD